MNTTRMFFYKFLVKRTQTGCAYSLNYRTFITYELQYTVAPTFELRQETQYALNIVILAKGLRIRLSLLVCIYI